MNHIELGQEGERLAALHLQSKKHFIRAQNYRYQRGEIDIISETDDFIIVTEVKTRQSRNYGSPANAVTRKKQRQLIQVMNAYLCGDENKKEVRFDLVLIILNQHELEIKHVENAFYPVL